MINRPLLFLVTASAQACSALERSEVGGLSAVNFRIMALAAAVVAGAEVVAAGEFAAVDAEADVEGGGAVVWFAAGLD